MSDEHETFESLRPLLFAIAYRMLASVSDAEDVLQETYLRWRRAVDEGVEIESLKAYLSTVVTRLAMDHLRSARARREAFLLHDVFGYAHDEIAAIVETTPANARQIASRARRRVQAERPRFDPSPEERERLAERFFAAVTEGDVEGLVQVLADDVVVYGDGGGKAPQWSTPIVGVDRVARLWAGVGAQMREVGVWFEPRSINGQPGAVVRDAAGAVANVLVL